MKELQRNTRRLVIRPWVLSDFKARQVAWSTLPDSPKNAWDQKKIELKQLTLANYRKSLRLQRINRERDRSYSFGVFLKDGTLIGGFDVMDITRQLFQNAYVGYFIFNRHWGKGYGKEAFKAVLDIAFRDLNLHRVEVAIEKNNRRSIALVNSVNLRKEGFSPRRIFLGGKWVSCVLYAATSEDFGIQWKKQGTKK